MFIPSLSSEFSVRRWILSPEDGESGYKKTEGVPPNTLIFLGVLSVMGYDVLGNT